MKFWNRLLTALAVTAIGFCIPRADALVSLEDGKDQLFIDSTLEISYDTNVFTNSQSTSSLVYEGSLSTEFARRAGWIGVNVTGALSWAHYADIRGQDYVDPKISAELTKQSGRTTGSLTMSVQRENRADVDTNTRDVSWNYDAGLNFQYPVIERYSVSGSLDYSQADYADQVLFTNQSIYSGNVYLYYILDESRDLFVDYRERFTYEAKDAGNEEDRSLSMGTSGRVYGPFNGSLQFGYQERLPFGPAVAGNGRNNDFTASGTMTWNMNRRMTLTANLSRDFSTTAEAQSLDTSTAGLTFQDSFTSKASGTLQVAGGENRFLGAKGDSAPDGRQRVDTYVMLGAGYYYTLNEHLKVSINCDYYRNWSTLPFADFPREQVFLELSTHW